MRLSTNIIATKLRLTDHGGELHPDRQRVRESRDVLRVALSQFLSRTPHREARCARVSRCVLKLAFHHRATLRTRRDNQGVKSSVARRLRVADIRKHPADDRPIRL